MSNSPAPFATIEFRATKMLVLAYYVPEVGVYNLTRDRCRIGAHYSIATRTRLPRVA